MSGVHFYKGGGERFIVILYDPDTKVKTWIHAGFINAFSLAPSKYTAKAFDNGVRIIVPIGKIKEEWFIKKMKETFDKWKKSSHRIDFEQMD